MRKKDIVLFIKSRNHYEMLFHIRNATKTLMHFSLIAWLSRLSLLVKIKVGKSLFTPSSFISWNYTMNNFPILLSLECLCWTYILVWKINEIGKRYIIIQYIHVWWRNYRTVIAHNQNIINEWFWIVIIILYFMINISHFRG